MNNKMRDFLYALSANVISFILSVVTGFLVPKYLGVEQYGYFKLFLFYATYVGFMHFGFIDGIYVKYGNYDYEDLPKEKFRGYFSFLMIQQLIMLLLLTVVIFLYPMDLNRKILFYFVLINMIILNLSTFLSFIAQITKRFKLFSINTILLKGSFVVGCLLLFLAEKFNYLPYVVLQTICNMIVLVIYIYFSKEVVIGSREKIKNLFKDIKDNIRIGALVMIGNLMSIIIVGLDRLFIDKFFSLKEFAYFSFAYNLISLFFVLLSSVTLVIYPYLSRTDINSLREGYEKIKSVINLVLGLSLSAFFMIKIIVIKFLPEYVPALDIFMYLTPTVLLSGQISILIANYFKVMKLSKEYSKNNIVAFLFALVFTTIAYIVFKSTIAIAGATLVTFLLWVWYSDRFFSKHLSINLRKHQVTEFIIIIVFLACALLFNWYMGMILYIIFFLVVIVINKGTLKEIFKLVTTRKK